MFCKDILKYYSSELNSRINSHKEYTINYFAESIISNINNFDFIKKHFEEREQCKGVINIHNKYINILNDENNDFIDLIKDKIYLKFVDYFSKEYLNEVLRKIIDDLDSKLRERVYLDISSITIDSVQKNIRVFVKK